MTETNTMTDLTTDEKTTNGRSREDGSASANAAATRILANYVGGRWVRAQTAGAVDITNPSSGAVLARVPLSGSADVEAAVAAASAALPDWRNRAVGERTEFIYALREKFRLRIDDLAASITRES